MPRPKNRADFEKWAIAHLKPEDCKRSAWIAWQGARKMEAPASTTADGWHLVSECLPPLRDGRVLVYTQDVSFGGEKFFDVPISDFYSRTMSDTTSVVYAATHWCFPPYPAVWAQSLIPAPKGRKPTPRLKMPSRPALRLVADNTIAKTGK